MTVAVGKCNRLLVTGGMYGMQDQSQIITKGFCRLVEREARLKEGTF